MEDKTTDQYKHDHILTVEVMTKSTTMLMYYNNGQSIKRKKKKIALGQDNHHKHQQVVFAYNTNGISRVCHYKYLN